MPSLTQMPSHTSVLLNELIRGLAVVPGGLYIDCTVGAGGHAEAVLAASSPGGRLLGLDADPRAIRVAERRLRPRFADSFVFVNTNFANLEQTAIRYGFGKVNGVCFDLGLSSMQLDEAGRGFSFQRDDPLDMRFSEGQTRTAANLVNEGTQEELERVIRVFGEETHARGLARRIVAARPVRTTGQLAHLIGAATPGYHRIHPATKTFQALRIWVNDELTNLEAALRQALGLLGSGGRLAVISFHSLEDRIVKTILHEESRDCLCPPEMPACVCGHRASVRLVARKVIVPTREEIQRNPRSRSAKLRLAEKV